MASLEATRFFVVILASHYPCSFQFKHPALLLLLSCDVSQFFLFLSLLLSLPFISHSLPPLPLLLLLLSFLCVCALILFSLSAYSSLTLIASSVISVTPFHVFHVHPLSSSLTLFSNIVITSLTVLKTQITHTHSHSSSVVAARDGNSQIDGDRLFVSLSLVCCRLFSLHAPVVVFVADAP